MSLFNKIILNCLRQLPGYYNESGKWIEPQPTSFTIKGTLQPLSPEEIRLLPEGRRTSESYNIFSKTELKLSSIENKTNPDIVLINGVKFEVIKVNKWTNGIIDHYHIIIVKIDEQSNN